MDITRLGFTHRMRLIINTKKGNDKSKTFPKNVNTTKISPEHYSPHKIILGGGDSEIEFKPILTEKMADYLRSFVPQYQKESNDWELLYSLEKDGISINTLFNKCETVKEACILVIQDTHGEIFGAYVSEAFAVKSGFYGNGQTFLFRHKNDGIKAYLSTGQNEHYILSENEKQKSLSIGASNGKFGLWVDQDLNNGTSEFCSTFNNEPLCLDGKFQISALEIWRIKF